MDFSSGTTHGDLGATGTPSHVNRRLSAHKLGTQVKLLYRSLKTVMITTELYNFDINHIHILISSCIVSTYMQQQTSRKKIKK